MSRIFLALPTALGLICATGVQAQTFGGSFDDGPAAAQQPAASTGQGGFGGSFDEPAGQPEPAPPPRTTTQPRSNPESARVPQAEAGSAERFIVDAAIFDFEARDFGVPPTDRLRGSEMHAATPLALPGGQLVSTQGLVDALGADFEVIVIDVLGAPYRLPGAFSATGLAEPGSFSDRVQQRAEVWLDEVTRGQRDVPIVIYCSDPQCWLSYNASLRTIAAGYTAVYWYRGGLQAWQMAGLGMEPSGF